jgi:hypothetical protein
VRTPGGSRTSAIARGREGATAGASAENGRRPCLSVAFSCPDRFATMGSFCRLRRSRVRAPRNRHRVGGITPPSSLDCACSRGIDEGRKRKSLSIAFGIERNSGIDDGDAADLTPLIALTGGRTGDFPLDSCYPNLVYKAHNFPIASGMIMASPTRLVGGRADCFARSCASLLSIVLHCFRQRRMCPTRPHPAPELEFNSPCGTRRYRTHLDRYAKLGRSAAALLIHCY